MHRRRSPLGAFAACFLAGCALLIAACDGGGASNVTPETTPSPQAQPSPDVSPEQQLLERIVLQIQDVPAGMARFSAVISTNEDVAGSGERAEENLARLESWGRLLGFDVTYQPGPEADPDLPIRGVNSAASLYLSPEGASASFADAEETARTQDWAFTYPELSEIEVREVQRPALADEVVWMRVSGYTMGDNPQLLIDDFVIMRRDRVRSFLRVTTLFPATVTREVYTEEVAGLAASQIERTDQALLETQLS